MPKCNLVPVVDIKSTGRANVNEQLADELNSAPIDYTIGYAYYVPAQYAHEIPPLKPGWSPSMRVFAVEYALDNEDRLVSTGNLTAIKLADINRRYFGEVTKEPAPVIHCELNEYGAYRPIPGEATYLRATPGPKGLGCDGVNPKIRYGMIYWADRIITAYVPKFDPNDIVNHSMVVDCDDILQLDQKEIILWKTEPASSRGLKDKLRNILPPDTPYLEEFCVD